MMILIYRDGKQYGPYAPAEVLRFIQDGHVSPTDNARTEEMNTWVKVKDLVPLPPAGASLPVPDMAAKPGHGLSGGSLAVAPSNVLATSSAHIEPGADRAAEPVTARPLEATRSGNAFTWPFHEEDWAASLWMPFLWWLPIFGTFLGAGWWLTVVRRRAAGRSELLPRSDCLSQLLKDGFLMALAGILYFLVLPVAVSFVVQYRIFMLTWRTVSTNGWQLLTHDPGRLFMSLFEKGSWETILPLLPIIFLFVGLPIFTAATIRFALTGRARSFLNVFGCIGLIFRYLGSFLVFFFMAGVTLFLLQVLPLVISSISALLPPTLVVSLLIFSLPSAAAVWITAYLGGNLAKEIVAHTKIRTMWERGKAI